MASQVTRPQRVAVTYSPRGYISPHTRNNTEADGSGGLMMEIEVSPDPRT